MRRLDLKNFMRSQRVQPDAERAALDLDQSSLFVQLLECEVRAPAKTYHRVVRLQLAAAIRFAPELVAGGNWPVHLRRSRGIHRGGAEGNSAGERAQACGAPRRVGVLRPPWRGYDGSQNYAGRQLLEHVPFS